MRTHRGINNHAVDLPVQLHHDAVKYKTIKKILLTADKLQYHKIWNVFEDSTTFFILF